MPWYIWYLLCGIAVLFLEVAVYLFAVYFARRFGKGSAVGVQPQGLVIYLFEILIWPLGLLVLIGRIIRGISIGITVYRTQKALAKMDEDDT